MKLGGIRYPYNKPNKNITVVDFFFFLNFRKNLALYLNNNKK